MVAIDKICYRSRLRYVNAGEKFAFSVLTLCICVAGRTPLTSAAVLAAAGTLTVWKGGVPFFRYMKYMAVPLAFMVLSTLAILLHVRKEPMNFFALQIGSWYITTGVDSLMYAGNLILTALSAVSCLYFLSFTTPMPDILEVLRKLHCPKLLLELMFLIYRFIFVLLDIADKLSVAQKCRLGNRNYHTSMKSFGMLGSALMIRAVGKSNKLYQAMEARCYEDTIHVLSEDRPPKKKMIAAIFLFEGVLLLLTIWAKLTF